MNAKRIAYGVLALIGILVVLAEIVLHVAAAISPTFTYELNHVVLIVGAILGFAGFHQLDPKGAKEIAKIVTDALPRFGRRSSDAIAIPKTETLTTAEPVERVPVIVGADGEKDETVERPKFLPGSA